MRQINKEERKTRDYFKMEDSIELRHVADPLYSKAARFLKKDWVVRKKMLENV